MNYQLAYVAAWLVAAVGIVCAGLAGASLTLHPSWLTPDVAATAGIIAPICILLGSILPQVQRTPAQRERSYLRASAGHLPPDLEDKYPKKGGSS